MGLDGPLGEHICLAFQFPILVNDFQRTEQVIDVYKRQVYYRENSRMVRPDLNATAEARVKGLVGLRDCVQELIDLQICLLYTSPGSA